MTTELSQSEEDHLIISPDYDHISYPVQPGSTNILIILKCLTNSCVYLVDSCVENLFYAGNIYIVVYPRGNEWGINYCWHVSWMGIRPSMSH